MMGASVQLVVSLFFLIFGVALATEGTSVIAEYDDEAIAVLPDGGKIKAIKGSLMRLKPPRHLTEAGGGGDLVPADVDVTAPDEQEEIFYGDEVEYDGDYYDFKDLYKDYYDGYYYNEEEFYDVSGEGKMKNNNMGSGMRERCKDCKDTVFYAIEPNGGNLRSRCRNRCRERVTTMGYSFKIFNKCPRLCDLALKTKSNGRFTKNPCEEVGYC